MKKINWKENHIEVEPTKKPKKITGTRLAAILGLNKWNTPFKTWCEITRTYEEPFTDNQYTLAGKTIEPVLLDLLKKRYFMDIKTPTDVYGEDYFKKTWGDFYHESKIFGGMWDAIGDDTIIEIKTTKRVEDWLTDAPEYYKMQAALYAWLSGKENIVFICAFLDDSDYEKPEAFTPVVGKNVIIKEYRLSEMYPNFYDDYIVPAIHFWSDHVETGISPAFTKADEEIIKALRRETVDANEDITSILKRIDEIKEAIEGINIALDPLTKELKAKEDQLKEYLKGQFTDGIDKLDIESGNYHFTLSKTYTTKVDTKLLQADGIYDKYATQSVTYRLTNKKL